DEPTEVVIMALDFAHALHDLDERTPVFLAIEALRYGSDTEAEFADEPLLPDAPADESYLDRGEEARRIAIRTLRTEGDPRACLLLREILRLSAEQQAL
ncbi:MAG: hypothetical protein D6776_08135, partial [Planctomycetota bacterium]